MQNITFVNEKDKVVGSGTKTEARANGIYHRIVRIFVFNSKGELLIQKRAAHVNSPNKWDQSAGGHVDEGEDYLVAAKRELQEEVGISGVNLEEIKKFYTENRDESELIKRFNMLYTTKYDGNINFDTSEVSELRWIEIGELEKWMNKNPKDFTRAFILAFKYYRELK